MASIDALYDLADAFLAASIVALEQTAAGPPTRAYVSPGQAAIDCEQLTVHVQTLSESPFQTGNGAEARSKAINRGGLAKATLVIQVARCVPVPEVRNGKPIFPAPADLDAAARMIDQDGWALWLGLNYALKHGTLMEVCAGAERLGGEKLIPQGGFGGWLFTYRVPLEGGVLGA